ncbi:FEKKY domain-containing protein [Chryseobacterium jejuense]|uniref:Uncharacterized protein n=1 Tax=Chryseobacterium jejuense TaxID=445960 RepID=A0A2X2WYT4_CHRJE|nr:hypothetical protein [Chryseobacterium jejuense]SDJ91547.1 hypothetical protein SAMN05421542_4658 [Chryseobacterium jejuense]SQB42963.1 Uncharacterised protein [Chryseobacterium jejuense]
MNKKLIWVNLILLLLVVAAYIFNSYIVNYPMMFNLPYIVKESRLEFLAVIFAFTALVSYLISSLDFKKLNFRAKFLRIFPIINGLVLLFFICLPANEFLKTQREISERENNYLLQAKKDIENNNVTLQYTSGISIPVQNPHTTHRIDSIQKKYGITYMNTGCIIDPIDNKAQKKYADAVAPFLEKRNGRNWQNRMQKEIDHLKEISDK